MTLLIIFLAVIMLLIVILQIGKISELAGAIRGEADVQAASNYWNSRIGVVFVGLFLILTAGSAYYYKNYMLGFGPHISASENGVGQDQLFLTTTIVTGIVFVLTQIFLFWYAYKYRGRAGHKPTFISHNDKLEIVWTAIPAVSMTLLVAFGLNVWNKVMADVGDDEDYVELEATGMQFAWIIRYPGADGELGKRNFRDITGTNQLGQVWSDKANIDDFLPTEIYLPVNKKVRVAIKSRDVLHNFDLPHFRVKMDAVPGLPTYFIFTPTTTTEAYRERLSKYPEYQLPADPDDPDGPQKWEAFEYELACAELCGKGHFSMRYIVKVVEQEEYDAWLANQKSYYLTNIRNTDADPFKGQLLNVEIEDRAIEFGTLIEDAIASDDVADDVLLLRHLFFNTGESVLKDDSKYELQNIYKALQAHPEINVEIAGHTDNTGDVANNLELSKERAASVKSDLVAKGISADRITAKGYGETQPIGDNATEEGRQQNRRTELRIISK